MEVGSHYQELEMEMETAAVLEVPAGLGARSVRVE